MSLQCLKCLLTSCYSIGASCYSIGCCECNCVVFPGIPTSYKQGQKDWARGIGLRSFKNSCSDQVPYLEMKVNEKNKCLIYFHGNGEDIGSCINFLWEIQQKVNINIYAMEYPTYGTYKCDYPIRISDKIKQDALQFFDYLNCGKKDEIVIFGRSVGSGPAAFLASRKNTKNLILMSPFTKISDVAKDFVGSIGSCLVKQHFNNEAALKNYTGRLLIVHGKIDEVIGYHHGEKLYNDYRDNNLTNFFLTSPLHMTHNYFDVNEDIVKPIQAFLSQQ